MNTRPDAALCALMRGLLSKSFWVLAAMLSMLTVSGASAQQGGLDANTLGSLIRGLEELQETGTFPGLTSPSGELDAAREAAAEKAATARKDSIPNHVTLGPAETVLARQFCSGAISISDAPLLGALPQFSRLERDYCQRAGELLLQFGYEIFDGVFAPEALLNGAAPADFRLGIGDELIITFVGQQSSTQSVTVDREGRVTVSQLPPIPAAGMTMAEFRRELNARTEAAFIGTQAFVSLGAVRQVSIFVVGEVARPGIHQMTALSSVIDALGLAGGVKKTGSLRQIRVHRGDTVFSIDLYDLLLGQLGTQDMTVEAGDRIVVPSIGPVVAVAGEVMRPGIFELAEGQRSASFEMLVRYSGGTLRPSGNVFKRISFGDDGKEQISEVAPSELLATNGDLIVAAKRADVQVGGVELAGHVRVPGVRSLEMAPTIGSLLRDRQALKPNPYLLFGVLETIDPVTNTQRYFGVSLQRILDGIEDYTLRSGDQLIVLAHDDIRYLSSRGVQSVITGDLLEDPGRPLLGGNEAARETDTGSPAIQPEPAALGSIERIAASLASESSGSGNTPPSALNPALRSGELVAPLGGCASLQALAKLVAETRVGRFSNAVVGSDEQRRISNPQPIQCRPVYEDNPGLLPFVLEYAASVTGEAREPGVYPLVQETRLSSLIGATGGLTRQADISRIEVSHFQVEGPEVFEREQISLAETGAEEVSIGPGDVIRFNPVFSDRGAGPVFLQGEFVRPGTYEIRRGEQLSQVIARAGGLTEQAYPFGAVFTRERVRIAEELALQRLARELNSAVTVAAANRGIDASAISSFAALTRQIAQAPATGRVVIEADPTVLQVHPELDIVLEPGDRIFMPKRPNSVLVTGDVLNPGAMQFVSGKSVDTYIRQAGGFQQSADRSRLFVVFPNGVAQPASVSAFNFTSIRIPPGSAIVVPKDATPFDFFTITREVASIVSQLAITAASLAVIGSN